MGQIGCLAARRCDRDGGERRTRSGVLGRAGAGGHGSHARGAKRAVELEETVRLVRGAGGRCEVVVGDVTERGLAEDVVAQTEATLGPVDMLVANAGLLGLGSLADIDPDLWRRVVEVDLVAPMLWNRAVLPGMRKGRGRIVNLTSVASLSPQPYNSAYAAAKVGLNQLTASLAAEVAQDGVVVIVLEPCRAHRHGPSGVRQRRAPRATARSPAGVHGDRSGRLDASLDRNLCFVMAGGADALTGQIVGVQPDRSETVEDLRDRAARKRSAMTGV